MDQARQEAPSRANNWHYQVLEHPREKKGERLQYETLSNIGQGCRGYMLRVDFAQYLDSVLVWQWVDVWMRAEAAGYGRMSEQGIAKTTGLAFPSMGIHPVNRALQTRGSERVAALVATPEMVHRPYITVSSDKEWGLSNRLNTLVAILCWANSMGFGIHVYWKVNNACNVEFPDLCTVQQKAHELPGVAFIAIHHDMGKFAPY